MVKEAVYPLGYHILKAWMPCTDVHFQASFAEGLFAVQTRKLQVKPANLSKGTVISMVFYGTTDIGKKRVVNQDNFKIKEYSPEVTLAVVCDGMGGAKGGGVASSLAISAFMDIMDESSELFCEKNSADNADEVISDLLRRATERANEAVFTAASSSSELTGMGTTLVCALVTPKKVYSVNVGDSRMYLCNHSGIEQITRDHSYVQYLVDIGRMTPRKAKKSNQRNIITRAVGTEPTVEAYLYTMSRTSNGHPTYVLLCSDGLSNMVEAREIASALKNGDKANAEALKKSATRIVSLANERGGTDNITAVILSY